MGQVDLHNEAENHNWSGDPKKFYFSLSLGCVYIKQMIRKESLSCFDSDYREKISENVN